MGRKNNNKHHRTTVVKRELSIHELAAKMKQSADDFEEMSGVLPAKDLVQATMRAGFGAALLAVGFERDDVGKIMDLSLDDDDCDCRNCSKK